MYLLLNPWVIKKIRKWWMSRLIWSRRVCVLILKRKFINFNSNAYSSFFLQAENLLLICLAIVRLYLNWVKSRCCWLCVVAACCANLDRSRDTWHVTAPHDNTSHSQASHADSRPAPGPCVLARSWPTSDRFHLVFLTTHCEILEVNLSVELIKTYQ